MGSNTTEGRLAELLLLWEELRDQGRETTLEEFCRECPEMIPLLGPRIEQLRLWDRFQGDTPRPEPDAPAPDLRRLPDEARPVLRRDVDDERAAARDALRLPGVRAGREEDT